MSKDLNVVYRDPNELKEDPRNSRSHSAGQVLQIRRSIDEFGFTNPVLLKGDGKTVGAGNGRLRAALLGPALKAIPTVTLAGLTDDQWRAYAIADNQIALNAGWNIETLQAELTHLAAVGLDLSLAGLDPLQLSELRIPGFGPPREDGETDPNAEWQGMPEFDQKDKTAFRSVVLHFADQAAVDAFFKLIGQTVTPKTRFAWYPEIVRETYADKRYATAPGEPQGDA
jgi:hypothetical protein